MLTPVGRLLEKTARRFRSDKFRLAQIREAWVEVVGEAFASQVEPVRLKGDLLFLTSSAPIWSNEVMLRQRVILERLNLQLGGGKAVARLFCQVGQVAATGPAVKPEEPIDWEAIQLDPEARERVARRVGEVRDPDLAASLERVLIQQERRRVWLIGQGFRPCPLCGQPELSGVEVLCGPCAQKERRLRRERILRKLGAAPWSTQADLRAQFPDLSGEEYLALRRRVQSILERQIWAGLRALPTGAELPQPLRSLMVDLCMLRTNLPSHLLEERHVRFALKKTLARAYLSDRVPELTQARPAKPEA